MKPSSAASALLVVHGLFHLTFVQVHRGPSWYLTGWLGRSWLVGEYLDAYLLLFLGRLWWGVTFGLFIAAALGFLGVPALRRRPRALAGIAATLSLAGFVIFWDGLVPAPWPYLPGALIDVGILVGLIWIWPPAPVARTDVYAA